MNFFSYSINFYIITYKVKSPGAMNNIEHLCETKE